MGSCIREQRKALGLTQSRRAQLSGLSRQMLVGLEAGALSDLGFKRVGQVLAVLWLLRFDSGEPMLDEWLRKRALGNQSSGASRTFVVADASGRVMGYYALAASRWIGRPKV